MKRILSFLDKINTALSVVEASIFVVCVGGIGYLYYKTSIPSNTVPTEKQARAMEAVVRYFVEQEEKKAIKNKEAKDK